MIASVVGSIGICICLAMLFACVKWMVNTLQRSNILP